MTDRTTPTDEDITLLANILKALPNGWGARIAVRMVGSGASDAIAALIGNMNDECPIDVTNEAHVLMCLRAMEELLERAIERRRQEFADLPAINAWGGDA